MKGVVPIRGDRRVFVIQGVGDVSFCFFISIVLGFSYD